MDSPTAANLARTKSSCERARREQAELVEAAELDALRSADAELALVQADAAQLRCQLVEANEDVQHELELVRSMFDISELQLDADQEPGVVRVRLNADDGIAAWLRFEMGPRYPQVPATVSVYSRVYAQQALRTVEQIAQKTAEEQAAVPEVAFWAVHEVVNEALATADKVTRLSSQRSADVEQLLPAPGSRVEREPQPNSSPTVEPEPQPSPRHSDTLPRSHSTRSSLGLASRGSSGTMRPVTLGISLRFLLRFCIENKITGFGKFQHSSGEPTWSVCDRIIVPATSEQKVCYVDLLEEFKDTEIGEASAFVSHAWGEPFASLVTALFAQQMGPAAARTALEGTVELQDLDRLLYESLEAGRQEMFFWIDIFGKNQHVVNSDATEAELAETVRACGNVVLILTPLKHPVMLQRIWCLFEIERALSLNIPITGLPSLQGILDLDDVVASSSRPLRQGPQRHTSSRRGNGNSLQTKKLDKKRKEEQRKEIAMAQLDPGTNELQGFTGLTFQMLTTCKQLRDEATKRIDVSSAQAKYAEDRHRILQAIEGSVGVDKMTVLAQQEVDRCLREWQAACIAVNSSARWQAAAQALKDSAHGPSPTSQTPLVGSTVTC